MKHILVFVVLFDGLVSVGRAAENNESLKTELQSSPHNILCEAYVANNWELLLMNADASGRKNLTNTPKMLGL